jgi:outer membrane protein OmpA-like peptidoglycan-associated protein
LPDPASCGSFAVDLIFNVQLMSGTQTIAWFVIGAGTAVAGYTGYTALQALVPSELANYNRTAAVEASPTAPPRITPSKAPTGGAADALVPSFDIVRVEPDGVSVMAGRAAPNSVVSILANDKPIATVRAEPDGGWSVAVEQGIEPGDLRLSLTARDSSSGASVQGQDVRMRIAAPASAMKPEPAKPVTGPALPSPVRFVYGEATFTSEGQKAAEQLAEYVKREGLETVRLSGHADERGSDAYNMELSRQRLEAMAQYLRDRGFAGKLVLIPKGRSEPFTGIDRAQLSREAAYALDRRVELRLEP